MASTSRSAPSTLSEAHQGNDLAQHNLPEVAVKPTPPQVIFSQMIHSALCRSEPIEELYAIREKINFEYDRAQQDFFEAFLEEERRAFVLWKEADQHVPEFFGCILHDGALFTNCSPTRFTLELREDWIQLMCEELEFLLSRPVWGSEEKYLARHLGDVLITLTSVWEERSTEVDFRLQKALARYMASEQLRTLLAEPESVSNVAVLISAVVAANASGYLSLAEEIAGLVPQFYSICQELFPDYFCIDGLELEDALDEDEEEELLDDAESDWDEVDEEEQLQREAEAQRHWEVLLDGWEGILQHSIQMALTPPLPYHRTKLFEDIVRFSPFSMIAYDAALDGLACASESAFRDFAPYLISRALRDPYGAVALLSVMSLHDRVYEPLSYDPREVVIAEIKKLKRKERNTLLRSASRLIKAKESPFVDRDEAQRSLSALRAGLKVPHKSIQSTDTNSSPKENDTAS